MAVSSEIILPQLSSPPSASFQRARGSRSRKARSRSNLVQVVVAWSAPGSAAPAAAVAQVELEAEPKPSGQPTWNCRAPSGWRWEEALCAAGCDEVLVTAQLGDDRDAKHLVLGLAERLTQKLAATKPLVRVRFLAEPSQNT